MNYLEQSKHPKWQKKRLEILSRDNFACLKCKETEKELHVHYKFYETGKKIWEYEDWALVTLCSDCHKYEHDNLDAIKKEFYDDLGMAHFTTWHYNALSNILHHINDLLLEKGLFYRDYGKTWNIMVRRINNG